MEAVMKSDFLLSRRNFLSRCGALAATTMTWGCCLHPFSTFGKGIPAGFRPLFDGKSLRGWHRVPRLGVPSKATEAVNSPASVEAVIKKSGSEAAVALGRWEVRDGVLIGGQQTKRIKKPETGEDYGLGNFLMTDQTFGDFELLIDVHPDWPCDTGIYVRSTELGQGFQVLLDHRGDDTGGIGGGIGFIYLRGVGGISVNPYNFRWEVGPDGLPKDVKLIPRSADKVAGSVATAPLDSLIYAASGDQFRKAWRMNDWNTFRIRVVGEVPRITTWINDVRICECDTAALKVEGYIPNDVKKLLGAGGHIGLEVHDGPPWRWGVDKFSRWRNIYIKELTGSTK